MTALIATYFVKLGGKFVYTWKLCRCFDTHWGGVGPH